MLAKLICLIDGHRWFQSDWYCDSCERCGHSWDFDDESPFVGLIPFIRSKIPRIRLFVRCDQCGKKMLVRGRFAEIQFCSAKCEEERIPF